MISARTAALEELDRPLGLLRCPFDHLAKELASDSPGAGTGDEDAARSEKPQAAIVDLLVDAERGLEAVLALGECRRVEHHHVEAPTLFVEGSKLLDRVCRPHLDILQAIELGVLPRPCDRPGILVDGQDGVRPSRQLEREAAVVTERVERCAAGKLSCAEVVLTLIEIAACLVIRQQIYFERHLAFPVAHDHRLLADQQCRMARQRLEVACAAVIARDDRSCSGDFRDEPGKEIAMGLRPFGEVLDGDDVAVKIGEVTRKLIGFPVDDANRASIRKNGSMRAKARTSRSRNRVSSNGSSRRFAIRRAIGERAAQNARPMKFPRASVTRTSAPPGRAGGAEAMSARKIHGWPVRARAAPRGLTVTDTEGEDMVPLSHKLRRTHRGEAKLVASLL